MDARVDMTMGTGMSRFVLLSAALHLGVLAALGLNNARPPLFPATLTIALSEASNATTASVRHIETRSSSVSNVTKHTKGTAQRRRSDTAHAMRYRNASQTVAITRHNVLAHDQSTLDNPNQEPSNENHSESEGPKDPNAAEKMQARTQPAAVPQAQLTDTSILSSQLESQLHDALAPYFVYPTLARRNGWEGQVRVDLRVEADGHLSHVHIAHSSGYRLLDSAALATLNHISAVPHAAGWLEGRHFDMVLPIDYRLTDGQS